MLDQLDWTNSEDKRDLVHRAVEHLVMGRLVIFPTETEYVLAASADQADAVAALWQSYSRPTRWIHFALAPTKELVESLPGQTPEGRRLARRTWPGPIDFVVAPDASLVEYTAEMVKSLTADLGAACLACPGHPAIASTAQFLKTPLILASRAKDPTRILSDQSVAMEEFGEIADAMIDDGKTRFGQPSTIVRIGTDGVAVEQEGVVSSSWIRRLSGEMITFVCTGNTCRSPMAEALFKRFLADKLGCSIEELPERGYTVASAGIAAHPGTPAAENAVSVVREYNAHLEDHISQPLTDELALYSDRLIVMTEDHKSLVCRLWPEVESRTTLLCGDRNVSDPIGGTYDRYERCAGQIADQLRSLLDDVTAPN
ncbi:Low molecular weight protein-tyrosine-phosphatase YwlE [Planctomycetes bacterium Pan216]|uniref:L-threonylcarbamoyladenylate synthase n=1 Tax=Kolteria novifilia TaxID=2527975 RepID=A0A518BAJ4_9BACT|nr:Low molecular weight protein-tyrosine-phosphatase YwlE [Planctomycetes bacterium Pan216]